MAEVADTTELGRPNNNFIFLCVSLFLSTYVRVQIKSNPFCYHRDRSLITKWKNRGSETFCAPPPPPRARQGTLFCAPPPPPPSIF